jgi:hypothetical protein
VVRFSYAYAIGILSIKWARLDQNNVLTSQFIKYRRQKKTCFLKSDQYSQCPMWIIISRANFGMTVNYIAIYFVI